MKVKKRTTTEKAALSGYISTSILLMSAMISDRRIERVSNFAEQQNEIQTEAFTPEFPGGMSESYMEDSSSIGNFSINLFGNKIELPVHAFENRRYLIWTRLLCSMILKKKK